MAQPSPALVRALRKTARRLAEGAQYQWSNFACCNCGNLVQTVTDLSPKQIHDALFARAGDWGEQAREFCPQSGYPVDFIFAKLFALGLDREDVGHLERLSDDRVLRRVGRSDLRHNRRDHVIAYLEAWADLLDEPHLAPALAAE